MADYLPAGDAEFNAWQTNFVTYANANLLALGLVAGDLTPITTAQTTWATAYPAHVAAQAAATAATAAKNSARAAYVVLIRDLVRRLQASPDVDNAEKGNLGITIPDPSSTPVTTPTTWPVVMVDCAMRLRHTIGFADSATPTKKAKPAGVLGAEIWVKLGGTPPADPSECDFLALDTATPYSVEYPGSNGGQLAHYMLRWVTATGLKGPWSETASVTIGA